jgi:hypothetical protein
MPAPRPCPARLGAAGVCAATAVRGPASAECTWRQPAQQRLPNKLCAKARVRVTGGDLTLTATQPASTWWLTVASGERMRSVVVTPP